MATTFQPAFDFYPRPPRGGRRENKKGFNTFKIFLSTPSARRTTRNAVLDAGRISISIHALREEGDLAPAHQWRQVGISIHALREEGDHVFVLVDDGNLQFLSTPSAMRATGICSSS